MADEKPTAVKLQFHYIKGPSYREVACHGAIGGTTAQGLLWMSLFSERPPIPRMVEFELPAPPAGESIIRFEENKAQPSWTETRNGVIRHIECTAYMDLDTAKRVHDWLGRHIARLEAEQATKQ